MDRGDGKGAKNGRSMIPIVEKLYRENQESYTSAGGFDTRDDEFEERRERINEVKQRKRDYPFSNVQMPDNCVECGEHLQISFLWDRFSLPVCNKCRDSEGTHKLIPRTEAKATYLLKDCDLDFQPLRYIAKKNPHNPRYGDMKLYLKVQLEERALELHGSWEELEKARQKREANHEARVERRFETNIKRMRKELQAGVQLNPSSLLLPGQHTHQYGSEERDEETGKYAKECSTCGHRTTYDKL